MCPTNCKISYLCDNCGKEVTKNSSRVNRYDNHYCSRDCYAEKRFGVNRIIWKNRTKEAKNEYWHKNKKKLLARKKEMRHISGFSKNYILPLEERIPYWIQRKCSKIKRRKYGILKPKTIQMIYEDNIKRFGTLTCIYCLKPIDFGKDTIEHKIPLACGGTHDYGNLGIACRSCNSRKGKRSVIKFLEVLWDKKKVLL
jgi:5-methylcytosine-specific restriction endonuclease McrA